MEGEVCFIISEGDNVLGHEENMRKGGNGISYDEFVVIWRQFGILVYKIVGRIE